MIAGGNSIDLNGEAIIANEEVIADIEFGETRGRQSITVTFADDTTFGPLRMNDVSVVDGSALTHFDSGPVPGGAEFPSIDIVISINGSECLDTVIHVRAIRCGDFDLDSDVDTADYEAFEACFTGAGAVWRQIPLATRLILTATMTSTALTGTVSWNPGPSRKTQLFWPSAPLRQIRFPLSPNGAWL